MFSKTCLKWPLKKYLKLVFKTIYCLMQVKSIAECSRSILQYFPPLLSYHLSLRPLFCLFLSGRFRQVLLYFAVIHTSHGPRNIMEIYGFSGSIIRKSRFIFTKERRTIRQKSGCLNHSYERIFQVNILMQGRIKDYWKGSSYV